MFIRLKPLVQLFSKTSITSLLVGSAIITFKRSLRIQLVKEFAELHRLGLKPYILCIVSNQFSTISVKRHVSWKLYKCSCLINSSSLVFGTDSSSSFHIIFGLHWFVLARCRIQTYKKESILLVLIQEK